MVGWENRHNEAYSVTTSEKQTIIFLSWDGQEFSIYFPLETSKPLLSEARLMFGRRFFVGESIANKAICRGALNHYVISSHLI
jgi:hypothetical protein